MPTFVDHDNKTCFIHIPRTAGNTYQRLNQKSNSYIMFKPATMILEYSSLELTTIVRNPYSRFISAFLMIINNNRVLYEKTTEGLDNAIDDNFIENLNNDDLWFFKPMVFFTHTKDLKTNLVKNIIKFEDIIKTPDYLTRKFENNVHFEPSNKAIAFINNLYEDDFREFNYEMKLV